MSEAGSSPRRPTLRSRALLLLLRCFRAPPGGGPAGTQWFAAALRPDFDTERGEYAHPDVTVQSNGTIRGTVPGRVACPGSFVVYASNSAWRFVCGDLGPDDALFDPARRNAHDLVATISCNDGCTPTVAETFAGWHCRWWWTNGLFSVVVAVELTVTCALES